MKQKKKSKYPWYAKYLFAAARRTFRWSPERRAVQKRAGYKCEICEDIVNEIQVDHIDSVVNPETGFTTWDDYYARLFVTADKMQGICKLCHKAKTKAEGQRRKKNVQ